MARVASLSLVLAAVVVLAGCLVPVPTAVGAAAPTGGPTTGPDTTTGSGTTTGWDTTTTASATDAPPIEVKGFQPGYDPADVLRHVERLRGLHATERIVIHEYRDRNESVPDVDDSFGAIRPAGAKALQLYSNGSSRSRLSLGYTVQRGNVTHVHLMNASDLAAHGVPQDVVLAHEFTHVLQFQHGIITPSRGEFREDFDAWTTDAQLVSTALYEGDAMVTTTQYYRDTRHEPFDIERYNETLARTMWPYSLGGMPYYYGYRYHRALADSPAERTELIRDPPASSRGLLHPDEASSGSDGAPKPPEWLAESGALHADHTDRIGELAIRHTLRVNGVSFPRAASAADGWTDDTMAYVTTESDHRAVVWTTSWEDADEAEEFRDAWRSLLDSKGASEEDGMLVVPAGKASPESTYVVSRDGDTVRIIWSLGRGTARSVANRAA